MSDQILASERQPSRSQSFHRLHRPGEPFLLPCAWDVASARLFAEAGHPVVGTTSLGVAAGIGAADEDRETLTAMPDLIGNISRALPEALLTCDFEDGYSDDLAAVVDILRDAFSVRDAVSSRGDAGLAVDGINIEDSVRGQMVAPDTLVAKVRAIRDAVPDLFVNARIDTFWIGQDNLGEVLERIRTYADAGAHGIFVPGNLDLDVIETIAAASPLPLNVLASPRFSRTQLAEAGVARISTGSLLYRTAVSAALAALDGLNRDLPADAENVLSYQDIAGLDSQLP